MDRSNNNHFRKKKGEDSVKRKGTRKVFNGVVLKLLRNEKKWVGIRTKEVGNNNRGDARSFWWPGDGTWRTCT